MATFKALPTRPLGRNGPPVARLGLGLMGASGMYGSTLSDEEGMLFLDEAYKRGERFWDTGKTPQTHSSLDSKSQLEGQNADVREADKYGNSEDLLGKWFAANPEKRNDIFLATKFGIKTIGTPPGHTMDSSPEYCRECIGKSLDRLGLPCVDLYYVHRLDKVTPIEKTMQAMVELKNAGKIKYIGLSECSAESLRRAHAVHPITCVQVEYSLLCTEIESPNRRLLEVARELGVAIVCYSPLANGCLTGSIRSRADVAKTRDPRGVLPWLKEENIEKNVVVLDQIAEIAKKNGVTLPQLALAWLLAQGDDVFPIPGSSSVDRLDQNLQSLNVKLSAEDELEMRRLAKGIAGGRYQEITGYAYADTPALDD